MLSRSLAPHFHRTRPVSLLYICYLGVAEPLVQTQVIPYLGGLATAGYGVVLLTFEPRPLSERERSSFRDALRSRNIEWRTLRYHKRPALPATIADIAVGVAYAAYLIRTRRISVVHARGHVPAAMALGLQRLMGTRFVFDIRGLLAEEYVDAGLWRRGGFLFRLVKRMEDVFLTHADAAVVLTRRARQWLLDLRPAHRPFLPVEVIPCCVDLQRFGADPVGGRNLRRTLGLDGCPILVYAGKFGGWYMAREMTDFFCTARRLFPDLRFLVLTQSGFSIIEKEFARRGIARDAYRCLTVSSEEIPEYLAFADVAVCFITPCFSKAASSPTKIGEYLAAGLPIVYNAGIGDLSDLEDEQVGVVVTAFGEVDYARAARELQMLLKEREATAQRCRLAAEKHFSLAAVGIPRYLRLYAALAPQRAPTAEAGWARNRASGRGGVP